MAKTYEPGNAMEQIATNLISNYHAELATAAIMWVFVDKASSKNGKPVLGTVKKCSPFLYWLTSKHFVIEVGLDRWNELSADQRTALVDHLLERCYGEENERTGEMEWKIREPDVHEFATILERYGAWHEGLEGFVNVAKAIDIDEIVQEESEEQDEGVDETVANLLDMTEDDD